LPLLILGNGVWAEEVADVARDAGFQVAGFVENLDPERCKSKLDDLPIHWIGEASRLATTHLVISGLGTTHRHKFTAQAAKIGFGFATVVHPTARVSSTSLLGVGTFINAGVVVAAKTRLGEHVNLNRGALIGHHSEIADFCSIQPGANIGGACSISRQTWVGIGATVIDHICIGEGAVIGAGAVVTRDLPSSVLAVGVPARIAKEGIEAR